MSALGIFKKTKTKKAKASKKTNLPKAEKKALAPTGGGSGTKIILGHPHLSEKASLLKEKDNAYVFVVKNSANKKSVGQEVERFYKVKVEKVRIINLPKKPKNLGRTQGYRPGFKKALVYLAAGQKIDLF
ncbi:MAG: 50S ribosomal protein L23 [Patescibacteria group bacterium]